MSRYIDADALNLEYEVDMADDWKTAHEMANIVKYAPTVDAVPVSFIQELIKQDNQFIEAYGGIQGCEVVVDGLIERTVNYETLIEKWREKNATETD